MSAWLFGVVVLVGGLLAARHPDPDPLGDLLAQVLHRVDDVEPTITCTPQDEEEEK